MRAGTKNQKYRLFRHRHRLSSHPLPKHRLFRRLRLMHKDFYKTLMS
jgi:hypothetical protein